MVRKYKDTVKLHNEFTRINKKCKHCGHSVYIPPRTNKILCNWCRNYVFKTEKDELVYRLNEIKIREEKQ